MESRNIVPVSTPIINRKSPIAIMKRAHPEKCYERVPLIVHEMLNLPPVCIMALKMTGRFLNKSLELDFAKLIGDEIGQVVYRNIIKSGGYIIGSFLLSLLYDDFNYNDVDVFIPNSPLYDSEAGRKSVIHSRVVKKGYENKYSTRVGPVVHSEYYTANYDNGRSALYNLSFIDTRDMFSYIKRNVDIEITMCCFHRGKLYIPDIENLFRRRSSFKLNSTLYKKGNLNFHRMRKYQKRGFTMYRTPGRLFSPELSRKKRGPGIDIYTERFRNDSVVVSTEYIQEILLTCDVSVIHSSTSSSGGSEDSSFYYIDKHTYNSLRRSLDEVKVLPVC